MNGSEYRLGLALVIVSTIAWSTAGLFTRLAPLDPWTLLAWRGVFGAAGIAVAFFALERQPWRALRKMGWPHLAFAVVGAISMMFYISSLRYTTVAHVAVIYAAAPFVAAAFGWAALGERPSRSAMLASLAALAGIATMVGFGAEGGALGDALAVAMTVSFAAIVVITRRFPGVATLPTAFLSAFLSGLACWPFGAPLTLTGHDLVVMALFGLVNSALGLTLFMLGARYLPAIETALIGALDAPLAPLWVWLAFGETPSGATLAGALIVFAAVAGHILLGARVASTPEPA
jgi:drug/metabolite transporter (DMT)-like permease